MLEPAAIDQRQPAAPTRGRAGKASSDPFALLLGSTTAAAESTPPAPRNQAERPAKPSSAKSSSAGDAKPQAPRKAVASEGETGDTSANGMAQATTPADAADQVAQPLAASQTAAKVAVDAVDAAALPAAANGAIVIDQAAPATPVEDTLAAALQKAATNGQTPVTPNGDPGSQNNTAGNRAASNALPPAAPAAPLPANSTVPLSGGDKAAAQPEAKGPPAPQPAAGTPAPTAAQQTAAAAQSAPPSAPGKPQSGNAPTPSRQSKPAAGSDQQGTASQMATQTAAAAPAAAPTSTAPTQPTTTAASTSEQAAASTADPDRTQGQSGERNGAPGRLARPANGLTDGTGKQGANAQGQAGESASNTAAAKVAQQQTAAQRAEALAERLAGSTTAERNFQAYLQRVTNGQVQGGQTAVGDDGAPQVLPTQQQAANAADAPLSAASARPTPPSPGMQVAVQIHSAVTNRLQRFNIHLEPAELGRVEVRLDFHRDGQVRATIAAERPETLDLLQKDVQSLERALRDAGTNTQKLSFSFDLQGGERQGDSHGGNKASSGNGNAADTAQESDELAADPVIAQRRIDGLIDIEV